MREDWEEILYKDAVFKIPTSKQKLKQKEYSQFGEFPVGRRPFFLHPA